MTAVFAPLPTGGLPVHADDCGNIACDCGKHGCGGWEAIATRHGSRVFADWPFVPSLKLENSMADQKDQEKQDPGFTDQEKKEA